MCLKPPGFKSCKWYSHTPVDGIVKVKGIPALAIEVTSSIQLHHPTLKLCLTEIWKKQK